MKPSKYAQHVTRTEIFSVPPHDLRHERAYRKGQADRKLGLPCRSANGAYLDGWYAPEAGPRFVPVAAQHLV